jgi:hypothetical protein
MRSAHASLETALKKERESAAEGRKLLLLAQNKLSGAAEAPRLLSPTATRMGLQRSGFPWVLGNSQEVGGRGRRQEAITL